MRKISLYTEKLLLKLADFTDLAWLLLDLSKLQHRHTKLFINSFKLL